MMFGVSNHLMLNHTSFSQLQSPSVVFENTKVSIDFGVWNDSKSPDMEDGWFAGVLNFGATEIKYELRSDLGFKKPNSAKQI